MKPLRGVNLGGWLVLEKWMTPTLFAGTLAVDEYSFSNISTNHQALQRHRDTFITETDFIWLAEQGIEAVRLPVGYWLFGDAVPYVATVRYVDRAFEWAEAHGLKILLDLHAAPGSQNGNDHSGQKGDIGWQGEHIELTLKVLERIAQRYGDHPALLGLSLLNEPSHTIPQARLTDFYERAAELVRSHCSPDVWLVFSDSFRPKQWYKRLPGLMVDHHHYQLFDTKDARLPLWAQVWRTRVSAPFKLWRMSRHHQVIIGEWSLGLHAGKTVSDKLTRRYGVAQLRAFRSTQAWFFWSYKTETMARWSYRDCVERGWL